MIRRFEVLAVTLILLGLYVAPVIPARATSVTVFAYPGKNLAEIYVNDSVYAVFTYPSGSFFSKILNGTSYSFSASVSNVPHNTDFYNNLQDALAEQDNAQGNENGELNNISLINLSVIFSKRFFANETTAVYEKSSVLIFWVSGIFTKNGTEIIGNFAWKSFKIDKHMYLEEGGKLEDLNFFGEDFEDMLGFPEFLQIPEVSTLNFSSFNEPLSQWNRTYNPSENITIFTKSVSAQTIYSENLTVNGMSYSLKIISDPTYSIVVQGYAKAVGNEIYVTPAPAQYPPYALAYIGSLFIAVIIVISVYLTRKKKITS